MKKRNDSIWPLVLMIGITCITQVVTVMKSSVVASEFGTSEAMDAYNFANSMLSFVFGIITSGVSTIILPAYVKGKDKRGINSFITVLYGAALAVVVLLVMLRYPIVRLFTNRSEMFITVACNALLILAVSHFFSSFTGITTAYLQNEGKYNTPKLVNFIGQVLILIVLLFRRGMSIYEYTFIISAGFLITFALDALYAVLHGWRFTPTLALDNEVTKDLLRTFLPIIFSSGVYKLSLFVDSMIASNLDEGKLTLLNYSNMIVSMVSTLIIGNILIYIYPKLIKNLKNGDNQAYFWNQSSFFHMIVCLLIVGFFAVGEEGIALLFQRGLFDAEATRYVYLGTLIYMSGQQFNIVRDLMYRYFYCMGNTKTPAQNSVLVSVTNIAVSIILVYFLGFFGIIFGTVIASALSTAMIVLHFHNAVKLDNSFWGFVARYAKNILSMLITGVLVWATKVCLPVDNWLISILVFGVETVVIYIGIVLAINKSVLRAVMD